MRLYDRPGRYATALWQATSKSPPAEKSKVQEDMAKLGEYCQHERFVFYLNDPSELKVKKQELLKSLLDSMKAAKPTQQLCTILAENNRLKDLPAVTSSFQQLVDYSKGT